MGRQALRCAAVGADLCVRTATGFPRSPVGADALVSPRLPPGQRQRGTWQNARVAPAERERKSIRDFPGPKVSPRETRLMKPKRGKANHPPPAAGGMRLRSPTRRCVFSLGPGAARSLFGKTKKRMGGALLPVTRHLPSDPDAPDQSIRFKYSPVKLAGQAATSSGVPVHTIVPPPSPPSGPRSMR